MTKEAAEKRLLGIDFIDKSDNEAGLQIADFVPNSFAINSLCSYIIFPIALFVHKKWQ